MKHYNAQFEFDKKQRHIRRREQQGGGFTCSHCKRWVVINEFMGTANRNHCNLCLWSKHVDIKKGDRKARCQGGMKPVGLTFKHEGFDRVGEIMLVHRCAVCATISINRIAADDPEPQIIAVYQASISRGSRLKSGPGSRGVTLLSATDRKELYTQLFGK